LKLDSIKIEQSRGLGNNPTEYHDQIVSLMRKNLKKIKEIVNQSHSKEFLKQSA
jgi:hypothetical protein